MSDSTLVLNDFIVLTTVPSNEAAKPFFRKVRPERGRGLDVGRAC